MNHSTFFQASFHCPLLQLILHPSWPKLLKVVVIRSSYEIVAIKEAEEGYWKQIEAKDVRAMRK